MDNLSYTGSDHLWCGTDNVNNQSRGITTFDLSHVVKEGIELLGNYGVAEAFNSVQPIGYPIRYSRYSGFIRPITPYGVTSRKLLRRPS